MGISNRGNILLHLLLEVPSLCVGICCRVYRVQAMEAPFIRGIEGDRVM